MTRICCISDIHGHLPVVPECDLLLLGGDLCFNHNDFSWYSETFSSWIEQCSKRMKIVGVAGNHDWIFQKRPDMVPSMNWSYLQDSGIKWNGFNIWGSPWQTRFHNWAFNEDEPQLEKIWEKIPHNTDILLLHGPPYGYGDFSPYGKEHTGSKSLLKKIKEIKPKLVVAGHIHSGYGRYMIDDTIFINASLVNESYIPANDPQIVILN